MDALVRSPSIFEVLACDNLKSSLREALRYLLDNLRDYTGGINLRHSPNTDEVILLLDVIIEYSHLRSYNASYSENLYNLIRVSDKKGTSIHRILPSLAQLVLIPYLRGKIDKYFEDLNYKEVRTADELQRIRFYRIFRRSCSILKLICILRFATGNSIYHSPTSQVLNVSLVGRSDDEHGRSGSMTDYLYTDRFYKLVADILGKGLTIGSYFIQFLDYWNTYSNSAPIFNASLPIPDPPSKDGLAYSDDRSSNICLICLQVRQNDCALSNTGYVFCYSCIHRFVKMKQKCPVTGNPTTSDNIIKLFTAINPS